MRKTLFQFRHFFKQRRVQQVCGFGISLAAVRSVYHNYLTAYCEEEKSNIAVQNVQSASDSQNDHEKEDHQYDSDVVIVKTFSELSDIIIHHKTSSECLVFLPGCSKETQKILLETIKRKRENKQIKVLAFQPSKNIPNAKIEKREQEKEKDLQERLKGVEFFGINSFGDLKYFSLNEDSQVHTKKNSLGRQINQSTYFQRITNFFSPPTLVGEREYPQLIQNIQDMTEEERIIISYIPEEKVYDANLPKLSTYDLYRQGRIKNISQLETRFRDISYEYIEKNTKFIIIRNVDVAHSLSIGKDDVGEIYILKRTQKQMNNESNWFFQGKEYLYNKIEWDPNNDTNFQLNQNQILEKLYQRNFNYINAIHTEQDLNNLLSSANEVGINKVLVYYSAEALEQDYEANITKKLISVKKNIPDQDFIIIFTKNPLLLKNYFRIIPDRFTDTVRLIDYTPNHQLVDNRLSDWTTLALYTPTNTVNFVPKELQISNQPTLYQTESDDALRYKYEGKMTRNKLTFFVKQSLQQSNFILFKIFSVNEFITCFNYIKNKEKTQQTHYQMINQFNISISKQDLNYLLVFIKQIINQLINFIQNITIKIEQQQYYETDHSTQQYTSRFLSAANFNREILQNKSDDICLVYFYKPGCPNCHAMNKAIDKFNNDLEIIKEEINLYEKGLKEYKTYDDNLINEYHINNFNKLKNVKIYRYNIYNECKEFPSPSASPLIFLFTKDNRLKPIQTDLLKDRVNLNDQEKVTRYLFKKLDFLSD